MGKTCGVERHGGFGLRKQNAPKALGMKLLLSIHYSDTWADPGSQTNLLPGKFEFR